MIGSGSTGSPHDAGGMQQYDFNWTKPSFPGTIIAGKFNDRRCRRSPNIHVYTTDAHKQSGPDYGQTAIKEFAFFSETFGESSTRLLNVVELPDDTVPAYWAPEIAAVAGARIADRNNFRLLANTIAHQWWGSEISPATLNDAWITNGMSRYGELMYLETSAGTAACTPPFSMFLPAPWPMTPSRLPRAGRLDPFSPEFQSMTLEKGAIVFHMLRWEVGDDSFLKICGRCSRNSPTNPSAPATLRRSPRRNRNSSSRRSSRSGWMAPARRNSRQIRRLPAGQ